MIWSVAAFQTGFCIVFVGLLFLCGCRREVSESDVWGTIQDKSNQVEPLTGVHIAHVWEVDVALPPDAKPKKHGLQATPRMYRSVFISRRGHDSLLTFYKQQMKLLDWSFGWNMQTDDESVAFFEKGSKKRCLISLRSCGHTGKKTEIVVMQEVM